MKAGDFKCKHCIYFENEHLGNTKKCCKDTGKFEGNSACIKLLLNYRKIDLFDKSQREIIKDIHKLKDSKLRRWNSKRTVNKVPTGLIAFQELKNRYNGCTIGETHYIKMFREDYLNNYARVALIAIRPPYSYVQGYINDSLFYAQVYTSSLISDKDFEVKREELIKNKKLVDPTSLNRFSTPKKDPKKTKTYKFKYDEEEEDIDLKAEIEKRTKQKSLEKHADRILKDNPFESFSSDFIQSNGFTDDFD